MGKVFHPGAASGHDDPISWNEPYYHAPNYGMYQGGNSWTAVPKAQSDKHPLPDTQIADHAIKTLRKAAAKAKSGKQKFFIAVGFHKPHLPFVFPEEFLSYYPEDEIKLPDNPYAPVDMPDVAWYSCKGLLGHEDIKKLNVTIKINDSLPADLTRTLRRAYYSALSFTDSLVGKVLAELDRLGLSNDTIVSFWGDHGWQLGEHGEWCKQTNFELATHAPMMIHIPGLTDKGIVSEDLTEYVDLFPTLVEAAGLPALELCPENSSNVTLCREGNSLMPLIKSKTTVRWKSRVFSQYPRQQDQTDIMGYTMRTDKYRYTEWVKFHQAPDYKPDWDQKFGIELYDHTNDPEENVNQVHNPAYESLVKEASEYLHDGWRAALPNE